MITDNYYISQDKEYRDIYRLIDKIREDNFVDKNTILVNCQPDYSSILSQLTNHRLSSLNNIDLYEQILIDVPKEDMSQIWNRESYKYQPYDKYLLEWFNKYIEKDTKYLFLMNNIDSRNFNKLLINIKAKIPREYYKIGTIYMDIKNKIKPDYLVQYIDKDIQGEVVFMWENKK